MKKLIVLLMMLLVAFSLTACNKDKEETKEEAKTEEKTQVEDEKTWVEPADDTTFGDFLNEKVNSLSSAKLDELVGSVSVNPDELADLLSIPSLSAGFVCTGDALSTGMNGASAALWQEGKVIYANVDSNDAKGLVKLDLNALTAMVPDVENVKPSEAINGLIAEAFGSTEITLDTFLNEIEFNLNDFEELGNDTYKLKMSALARIIADLSMGAVEASDLEVMLAQMGLNLTVKFNNGKVRNLTVELKVTDEYMKQEQKISMDLFYGPEGLNGYSADVVSKVVMIQDGREVPYMTLTAHEELTSKKMAMSVDYSMDVEFIKIACKAALSLDANKLEGNIDLLIDSKSEVATATVKGNIYADSAKAEGKLDASVVDEHQTVTVDADLTGTNGNNKLTAMFKVSENNSDWFNGINVTLNTTKDSINGTLEVVDQDGVEGTIGVELTFAENWISKGKLTITAGDGVMTINLAGGSNAKIPTVDKSQAMDLLELMMNSNGGREEVYPEEKTYY